MPWDAQSFKAKHNHSLTTAQAGKAAKQATAMVNSGVDEGVAIATANKHINKLKKRGVVSERAHDRMKRSAGLDDTIDAASA